MDIEKIKNLLKEKGIILKDDYVLKKIMEVILLSSMVKLSVSSKLKVINIDSNQTGIIYLWKGFEHGEVLFYPEISPNIFSSSGILIPPEHLKFIHII